MFHPERELDDGVASFNILCMSAPSARRETPGERGALPISALSEPEKSLHFSPQSQRANPGRSRTGGDVPSQQCYSAIVL